MNLLKISRIFALNLVASCFIASLNAVTINFQPNNGNVMVSQGGTAQVQATVNTFGSTILYCGWTGPRGFKLDNTMRLVVNNVYPGINDGVYTFTVKTSSGTFSANAYIIAH